MAEVERRHAEELVWQVLSLCRAGFQLCRKVRNFKAASAAGLLKIELPQRLFRLVLIFATAAEVKRRQAEARPTRLTPPAPVSSLASSNSQTDGPCQSASSCCTGPLDKRGRKGCSPRTPLR